MSEIFISHVEEDESIALEIAHGLEAAGYSSWYYERDSLPGVSYLDQIDEEIEGSVAVVVIISANSMSSSQVDKEVERAHESGKHFFPVLRGVTHAEFQARKRGWRMAMGVSTSILVPPDGASTIVPRIVKGLQRLVGKPEERVSAPLVNEPAVSQDLSLPKPPKVIRNDSATQWQQEQPHIQQTPAPRTPDRGEKNAVIALALGITSLLCFGIVTGPIAIILGSKELRAIDAGRSALSGRSKAKAAIILGVIGITIFMALLILGLGGR